MTFHVLLLLELSVLMCSCQSARPSQAALPYNVRFVKSGGITGAKNQLDIDPAGQSFYKNRKGQTTYTLSNEELTTLNQLVLGIDTLNLKPEYKGDRKVFDGFQYSLKLGSRTTELHDGAIPDQLQRLVNFLNQILIKTDLEIKNKSDKQ